ncbi:P-loop containing nucleoside triphosphate hydrolase protein [Lineolata rhizophorae]|uniref:ATP-dependent RNA helicase n=1 Tax=Lineolata rhizophorae TaxID=578093 RepID=A0A6A6P400_9PEZI|nr:P-loop containing nucleoside triphosphate hydrolase protein [Lineolata rhizophorae]
MFGALRRCPASLARATSTSALRMPRAVRATAKQPALSKDAFAITGVRQALRWQHAAASTQAQVADPPSQEAGVITRFSQLKDKGLIHPNVINTITKRFGFDEMTDVQSKTINEALAGDDVIAQAKTGTGKTLAFLLPILQNVLNEDPSLARKGFSKAAPDDIRAIIISPTRELAEQIAFEARKLVSNTGLVVQTAVGGTQKRLHLQNIRREGCHILVATPGRLRDVLEDSYTGISAPKLTTLVLDEADRLMDHGFWPEIMTIQRMLPQPEEKEKQTLMFSATIPPEVVDMVRSTMRPGFHFIKCVRDDEAPTHERVPQKVVFARGFENRMPALLELCVREYGRRKQSGEKPFKAIVYFNSTAEVNLAYRTLNLLESRTFRGPTQTTYSGPLRFIPLHGKMSQQERTRSTRTFKMADSAVLLSSDVSARGMDFPDVTHVVQMSLPHQRETYVHRIGRTGRAGKEGEGWLIASELERQELPRRLRDLPIEHDGSLVSASVDMTKEQQLPMSVASILTNLAEAHRSVPLGQFSDAYHAHLGSFQWLNNKQSLIYSMNAMAKYGWGCSEPPPLGRVLVEKMGLAGLRGINVREYNGGSRSANARLNMGPRISDPFGGDRSTYNQRDPFSSDHSTRGGGRDSHGGRDPFGRHSGGGRGASVQSYSFGSNKSNRRPGREF